MSRYSMVCAFAAAFALSAGPAFAASESIVYSFQGGKDAYFSESGLALGKSGLLYGVTPYGGIYGHGAVYEVKPGVGGGPGTEKVIYSFKGGTTDGATPFGRLLFDAATGALYGTTYTGGASGIGTVFRLAPPTTAGGAWTRAILYNFKVNADGAGPLAGLTKGPGGVLYGTTRLSGGVGGMGTVFALTPPSAATPRWTEKLLAVFHGKTEGSAPGGAVVLDAKGNIYGTTLGGGANGQGTVYRVSPPVAPKTTWTTKILYSFKTGSDGQQPLAELILDPAGALYGTTFFGGGVAGGPGVGTVFKLTPGAGDVWTESVIYRFKGGLDSGGPQGGLLRDAAGALYGTTGGTVFKLTKPTSGVVWTETVLHRFGPSPDGSVSFATPIKGADGALYGTTFAGGAKGVGTVFRVAP